MKRKRKWVYIQKPQVYGFSCNVCGGVNITWSEYEGCIWCFSCKQDVPGQNSIFNGPIPLEACEMLGVSFDRIDLKTGDRLYMRLTKKGNKVIWRRKPKRQK